MEENSTLGDSKFPKIDFSKPPVTGNIPFFVPDTVVVPDTEFFNIQQVTVSEDAKYFSVQQPPVIEPQPFETATYSGETNWGTPVTENNDNANSTSSYREYRSSTQEQLDKFRDVQPLTEAQKMFTAGEGGSSSSMLQQVRETHWNVHEPDQPYKIKTIIIATPAVLMSSYLLVLFLSKWAFPLT